ncbi:MAG: hypothetical protein V3U65_02135 [Granulosicoccaceae bacterium]
MPINSSKSEYAMSATAVAQSGEELMQAPITRAATLLKISEFKLFSEAYLNWFGDRPDETDITLLFAQFMMFGDVPPWADQFARNILADIEANREVSLNSFSVLNLSPRIGRKAAISFTLAQPRQ